MINMETVEFIDMLNKLAEKTKNGIIPFSKCLTNDMLESCVVYDDGCDKVPDEWLSENPSKKVHLYLLVLGAIIDDDQHDIISYHHKSDSYRINVMLDTDKNPYIIVSIDSADKDIIIENGEWSVCV